MTDSRIPGFYRLDIDGRHKEMKNRFGLSDEDIAVLSDGGSLDCERADKMVENCVGVFGLPVGLGLNFQINGRDFAVPMVVEEPSVVAAVSNMARLVRTAGGFQAEADRGVMIAQVQVVGELDDGRRDGGVVFGVVNSCDELSSDLHRRNRESAQVAQRGVTGPEVV